MRYFIGVVPLAVASMLVTSTGIAETAPWRIPTYGTTHHQDSLANTQIGTSQRKAAYRFRAERTGHVMSAQFYVVTGVGYSGGTGGSLLVEIRTDDPGNPGFPSNQVLGSAVLSSPLTGPSRPTVSFSAQSVLTSSDLSNLPFLEEGTRYHLVFTNTDANPQTNFVSVDCSYMTASQGTYIQPDVLEADLAHTMTQNGGPWAVRAGFTPIFEIHYWNLAVQGRAYQYGAESHDPLQIDSATNYQARERFTVSGGDRPATAMYARLKKVGTPSSLSLQVRKTSAPTVVLASVNIAASAVSTTYGWVGGTIDYILEDGEEYYFLVKENSGGGTGHYLTYPLDQGSYNGFQTGFLGGAAEKYEGSGNWLPWQSARADMMFYFSLAE